jgi:hypothetical protein
MKSRCRESYCHKPPYKDGYCKDCYFTQVTIAYEAAIYDTVASMQARKMEQEKKKWKLW